MATIADQMKKMGQQVFPSSTVASTSSGGMMPQMKAMPATAAAPQYDDSSASNLAKITAAGSPVMTQAANAGLATANRRGLLNSSIAAGSSQAEVLKVATPLATADASINAQKNLVGLNSDASVRQIQEQGKVTGGLQQQQIDATKALSSQEASQLSALEKQKAAATTEQQKTDIQAQMDRLLQSQTGTSALSSQEAAQLSALEKQRCSRDQRSAARGHRCTDVAPEGSRERSSFRSLVPHRATSSSASFFRGRSPRSPPELPRTISARSSCFRAASSPRCSHRQTRARCSDSPRSIRRNSPCRTALRRRTSRRSPHRGIRASGRHSSPPTRRESSCRCSLRRADREKAASLAVQVFSAEAAIRQSLLANTSMPAAERAAYEQAISSLGDPMRNFLNNLYSTTNATSTATKQAAPVSVAPASSAPASVSRIADDNLYRRRAAIGRGERQR